jgi:hypothetical protein
MEITKPQFQTSPDDASKLRGLVVSSPITIDRLGGLEASSDLDPQELRMSLLFWDKIAWPANNAIYMAGGDDEGFLESIGVIIRPTYAISSFSGELFPKIQALALQELDTKEPGQWSIGQGVNSILVSEGFAAKSENPELLLYKAIPVPDKDVPLTEILLFKEKRRAELDALRFEIDGLIATINAASDKEQELKNQIARLDKACADALIIAKEWNFPFRLVNYKATYELRPFATLAGALAGFLGSNAITMSATGSALTAILGGLTATAPALKLSFDGLKWDRLRQRQGPYRYVYDFHKELF